MQATSERRGRAGRRLAHARAWWAPALVSVLAACAGGAGPAGTDTPAPEGVERPESAAADTVTAEPDATPRRAAGDTVVDDTTLAPPPDTAYRDEPAEVGTATEPGDTMAPGEPVGETPPELGPDPEALVPAELPVPILPGALLPRNRIVAFYGNPASTRMGILGELPPDEMLRRLDAEVAAWMKADPGTPVLPALQVIAVMATGDPGRDSLFRLRTPHHRIRQVARWAERRDGLLFLDIQPGWSTVADELEPLRSWLVRPHVHLALDPEWAMPPGTVPGRVIGSLSADDINHAIDFLAEIVERHHLPPKVLVVHRFTEAMIREADRIRRDPRVQVVINMDGWGPPPHKMAAYRDVVAPEADQYTGIKLFFHNDIRGGSVLLTPDEILQLDPEPRYIQYQ